MNDPACSHIRAHLDTVTDPDELRRHANAWAETAAQHARNEMFYRGLVQETGRILGRACYRQDDGNYVDEPLALRVPEVAREMVALLRQAEWSSYDGCDDPACPWCRQSEDLGHIPTCPVASILYPKERA